MSEFSKNVKIIESRLRIMTWNIWWRFGPWVQREPAILQCIADLNPDVIALQEVWGDGATHTVVRLLTGPDLVKLTTSRVFVLIAAFAAGTTPR